MSHTPDFPQNPIESIDHLKRKKIVNAKILMNFNITNPKWLEFGTLMISSIIKIEHKFHLNPNFHKLGKQNIYKA
jgi:hypothetical protein